MDDNTIKAIEQDIKAIDPSGLERVYKQRERRRLKRVEYNRQAYIKHKDKLKARARARYNPVTQAPIGTIDYTNL